MNTKLQNLYKNHWDVTIERLNKINETILEKNNKATNPLLLKLSDESKWSQSTIKLMFFGKETMGWEGEPTKDIEKILNNYDTWYNSGVCFHQQTGHFFRGLKKIERLIDNESTSVIWNNLIKIGKYYATGTSKAVMDAEYELFPVVPHEIKILQPNVVVFATGHTYDNVIRKKFSNVTFIPVEGFKLSEIAMVKSEDLPQITIRTYHPRYMFFKKEKFFEAVSSIIKTNFK